MYSGVITAQTCLQCFLPLEEWWEQVYLLVDSIQPGDWSMMSLLSFLFN